MENIKKIIKEEINDFDWAKDIDPTHISNEDIKKFHTKMVNHLILSGRVISNEWSTFKDFLIELEELGEVGFINLLMLRTLPESVSRPYPYILEAIKDYGFDVNTSTETKRLYDKFYKSQPILKRLKTKIFGESINDFDWVKDIEPYTQVELILSDMLGECEIVEDDEIKSYTLDGKTMFRYNEISKILGVSLWDVAYPLCSEHDIVVEEFDKNIIRIFSEKFNLNVVKVRHVSWGS